MEPKRETADEFARTLENIPTSENEEALRILQKFNEQNVDGIAALDELAEATKGVGEALMKVAFKDGQFSDKYKNYTYAPEIIGNEEKLEEEMEENPRNVFSMVTNGNQSVTLVFKPYGIYDKPVNGCFEVTIPVAPINIDSPDSQILGRIGGWSIDNDGKESMVQPRNAPNDAVSLRKYAQLIKQGVAEVLKTNPPPPAEIPPAFYQ